MIAVLGMFTKGLIHDANFSECMVHNQWILKGIINNNSKWIEHIEDSQHANFPVCGRNAKPKF